MSPIVLVTGPTGKVGRRLIPLLTRRGVTARPASRSSMIGRSGVEPVRFDWTDESTYEAARTGVDGIYLVTGGIPQPHHADWIRTLLDGAAADGVARVVLLSVYGTDQAPPENHLRRIELAVESSGAVHHPATDRVHAELLRVPLRQPGREYPRARRNADAAR